jgi:hypothetical protein
MLVPIGFDPLRKCARQRDSHALETLSFKRHWRLVGNQLFYKVGSQRVAAGLGG